jgi:glycosyltransferase involved in cell wall biosynthesis
VSTPWLHVLIPVYGRPELLAETLDSVRGLAGSGVPVTVVDDASPDGDVEDLVGAYPGIEYRRNDVNLGVAGNFNHCAELSTGDYTVLLGSDDLLLASYADVVHRLVSSFARPAMAMASVRVVDVHGMPARPLADRAKGWVAPRGAERLLSGQSLARSLLLGNWLYFPAIAWRTDLLRAFPFRPEQRSAMDLDVELRLVFAGHGLAWSPEVAACYRRHDHSVSSTEAAQGARFAEERAISRWAAEQATARGWSAAARAARLRPLSRLHAASVAIPRTLRSPAGSGPLWAHALGR